MDRNDRRVTNVITALVYFAWVGLWVLALAIWEAC